MKPQAAPAHHPLVAYLDRLLERHDRGALSELRRSLTRPPGAAPEAYRHVYPYLGSDAAPREETALFITAGLYALLHQGATQPLPRDGGMGHSLHDLRRRSGNIDAIDRRVRALLDADRDALTTHLRHLITQLRAESIGVDFDRLIRDLRWWDHPDRFVQRRWARDYWRDDQLDTPTPED